MVSFTVISLFLIYINKGKCTLRNAAPWSGHFHDDGRDRDGLDRKSEEKSSQQVLSICGNSFKTVGKAFQMKLVERMPRACKAVIKAKGGYFEES